MFGSKPAGWRQGGTLLERELRKPPIRRAARVCRRAGYRDRFAGVKRGIGVGANTEVIDEIVVDSEAGPHRPGSPSGRIPSKAYPWLQQVRGFVCLQAGITDVGIGLDDEAGIIEVVRTPARLFIPAVGHLVS
jgi:hypothetical protein